MSRWAPLLLLVLGFGAGLAVGLAVAPRGERARSEAAPAAIEREAAPPAKTVAPARAEPPPPVGNVDVVSIAAVPPTGDLPAGAEVADGLGRLVVRFEGVEMADVFYEATTLTGKREAWSFNQEQGKGVWEDLPPGIYVPYWELPDRLGRWGVRARVETGRVTRVEAKDAFELPLPEGLGRLDVAVRCAAGLSLHGVEVFLAGQMETVSSWTNARGEVRFEVLPGRFAIWVGSRETTVDVLAGASVVLQFEPLKDGDILFDLPPNAPKLWLRPTGGDEAGVTAVWWHGRVDGRIRQGWFFVPPGEYYVSWGQGLEPIGTTRVRAGQATVFAGPTGGIRAVVEGSPTGSLRVEVERFMSGAWQMAAVVDALGSFAEFVEEPNRPERIRHVPYLTPGTYRIQVTESQGVFGPDRKTEHAVVQVGSGWTDVRLRFDR